MCVVDKRLDSPIDNACTKCGAGFEDTGHLFQYLSSRPHLQLRQKTVMVLELIANTSSA